MEKKKEQSLQTWEQEEGEVISLTVFLDGEEVYIDNPSLTVSKKLGVHTKAELQGQIGQEVYTNYVLKINSNSTILFKYGKKTDKIILFYGLINYVDAKAEGLGEDNHYQLKIEALSFSCLLDREIHHRSFQEPSMTYRALTEEIVKDSGASFLMSADVEGNTIGGLTLQYQETDWEFLKRMASRFHLPLVASHISYGKKFTFGVIWKEKAYVCEESKIKQCLDICTFQQKRKEEEEWAENSKYYEIITKGADAQSLEIGESILLEGKKLYVYEVKAKVKNHVLFHRYKLTTKKGFFRKKMWSKQVVGLSLPGEVAEVKKNLLRVHLDIDKQGSNDNCWFSYSTFYSTFYCMPEVKDRVNLYFPDKNEANAFVLNSICSVSHNESETTNTQLSGIGDLAQKGEKKGSETTVDKTEGRAKEEEIFDLLGKLTNPQGGKLSELQITPKTKNEEAIPSQISAAPQPVTGSTGGGSTAEGGGSSASSGQSVDFEALAQNENVKMLATKDGNMVILDDDSGRVSIICQDGSSIHLADGQGISIITNNSISFSAKTAITFTAKQSIFFEAEEEIALKCKESSMVMTEEKILITGTDIKLNE